MRVSLVIASDPDLALERSLVRSVDALEQPRVADLRSLAAVQLEGTEAGVAYPERETKAPHRLVLGMLLWVTRLAAREVEADRSIRRGPVSDRHQERSIVGRQ